MTRQLIHQLGAALSLIALWSCDSRSFSDGEAIATDPSVAIDGAGIELGAAIAAASADQFVQRTVDLTGAQTLPANDTRHTGRAQFTVDTTSGQMFGTVTTSQSFEDEVTEVHVHEGAVGELGAVVVTLVATAGEDGNAVYNVPDDFTLSAQQLSSYVAGNLYIDSHSGTSEIRGQISDSQPVVVASAELSDLQTKIFTPLCSGCHTGAGVGLPSVLSLASTEASYRSLVSEYSIGEPDLLRVEPGSADNSLLVRKIEGMQTVGARMPLRSARLDDGSIDAIRQWIDSGARP